MRRLQGEAFPNADELWGPAGDAIVKEISWAATDDDVVMFDRRSCECWLTATVAVERGEMR